MIFSGTGVHGAYHAGVLRALQEAGVRIDVVAGHGVGAATAMMAAIDGGSRLWEDTGIWARQRVRRYYRWRWPLRSAARFVGLLVLLSSLPALVLLVAAFAYAGGFLLSLLGIDAGPAVVGWVSAGLTDLFAGALLPTVVPRLVMLVVLAGAGMLAVSVLVARQTRDGMGRVVRVRWWWRVLNAALETSDLRRAVTRGMWELVRGAATSSSPSDAEVSRRYCEVLVENLGQPGCRELMVGVTDLDARRDVIGALLSADRQEAFFASQPGRERGAEVVDFAWSGRELAVDMLGAALTPGFAADAHPVAFPQDGYWHGETHRACDRAGIVTSLIGELRSAGVVQVVLVTAAAPAMAPNRLRRPAMEPRARLGEFFAAAEAAEIDAALALSRVAVDALFVVRPTHNPVGPFESSGTYDEGSDRRWLVDELRQQGYRDAYQQFIDPVVGASGDELAPAIL